MQNPIVFMYWGVVLLAVAEYYLSKQRGLNIYSKKITETNTKIGLGFLFVTITVSSYLEGYVQLSPNNKIATLPNGLLWTIGGFLFLDFLAYVEHRASHRLVFFWTEHAVHHSSSEFNLFTNLRHGWTKFLSTAIIISFVTGLFGNMGHVTAVYFFISFTVGIFSHTQLIHKLGILEIFLVTPSHHRVHHSISRERHDNNYGAVFIFWDKIFGTFLAEGDDPVTEFGLENSPSMDASFLKHVFFAWQDFFKNFRFRQISTY